MSDLSTFFSANRPLLVFLYGQTFFLMGFAILLQLRRESRLDLARHLPYLALFGIAHGLNEWGDLFIPIQATFMPDAVIQILESFQTVLMAGSFIFLMQFGVELLLAILPPRWKRARYLPIAMFFLWLALPFTMGFFLQNDASTWIRNAGIFANYFLCLPASMLAAFGLREYARTAKVAKQFPKIYSTLRFAGLAFIGYGILDGIFGPPADFFPAVLLNYQTISHTLLIPKTIFLTIVGITVMISIIRSMEIFSWETNQLIEHMEQGQVVAVERERIGRDLHDGALQRIYAAGLLAQSLRKKVRGSTAEGIDRLMTMINETIDDLRKYLSDLRPVETRVDLTSAIESILRESQRAFPGEIRFNPEVLPALPSETVAHISAFTREAVSNALRHAKARHILVSTVRQAQTLILRIRDDGIGLPENIERGFGLRNMQERASLMGGKLSLNTSRGKGTIVELLLPLEEAK